MFSASFCCLHRYIIEHSDRKAELYPCLQDECSRITFADYSVPLQDTANSWVVVFRLENVVTSRFYLSVEKNFERCLKNLSESSCK